MLKCTGWLSAAFVVLLTTTAGAQDYRVEKIEGRPSDDEAPAAFTEQMAGQGYRIQSDSGRTVAEIWLAAELEVKDGFQSTPVRLYGFQPGQLIGLLHFPRRGSDFRDQQISSGWYTLRYELQPVDGNHVGTSPTQDFLLLIQADADEVGKQWSTDPFHQASAEAAGSSHPAMLSLQSPSDGAEASMRHSQPQDWQVLHVVADGKTQKIPIDIVVVGHAAE